MFKDTFPIAHADSVGLSKTGGRLAWSKTYFAAKAGARAAAGYTKRIAHKGSWVEPKLLAESSTGRNPRKERSDTSSSRACGRICDGCLRERLNSRRRRKEKSARRSAKHASSSDLCGTADY